MKLPKLANWFSDGDLEKYKQQAQHQDQAQTKLQKLQSELAIVKNDLQKSQKELTQLKAQLQINQGFQIELGETQLKLKQVVAEARRYKQELFERQKEYDLARTQFEQTKLALSKSQNWTQQLKTPISVAEIEKTLPKQNFETLWGFGIIAPTAGSVTTTGAILVKGWVLGRKALAETLKVSYQNDILLETPVNLRRPTVIQQYPDIPSASTSGFEFSLSVAGISTRVALSLNALLADQTVVPLCNLILQPRTIESNDT